MTPKTVSPGPSTSFSSPSLDSDRSTCVGTETISHTLQLSEGYRSVRRTISILCAIALGWSTAQFDLKAISLGFAGSADLSRASIPVILVCAIAYSMARCVLEFAMQSVEVRRWRYAQADIKLSVFLVQATILILAASGLDRSVDIVLYVALAVLAVLVGATLARFTVMMGLMPLLIYVRSRQGRRSIASRTYESLAWTELIVVLALVVLLVVLGVASLHYEPLRSLWTIPPSALALALFVFACVAIVVSTYLQRAWYEKLFAAPPGSLNSAPLTGEPKSLFTTVPRPFGIGTVNPLGSSNPLMSPSHMNRCLTSRCTPTRPSKLGRAGERRR